jgi:uncharacterized membrane protein
MTSVDRGMARRDAWLYAAIALPVAIAFAFLTPPFQSPDEVAHYWRATAISRGQLVSTQVGGRPTAVISRDARDLVATLWMELAGTNVKFDRSKFQAARQLRPSQETVRVSFPAFYTAMPYVPQAIALWAGGLTHCPTLYAFYSGRVMNAIAGVLLIVLAMRLLPEEAWVFGSIGLTPMFLYLAGTFSADVVTTGLAFCAIATALGRSSRKAVFPLFAALLSLAKPGYALITMLSLPRLRERRERVPICVALVAAGVCGWLASAIARAAYYPLRRDVVTDASSQLAHVAASPSHFLQIAVSDYAHHATQYLAQMIGRLGWLDIGLPQIVYVAYALLFVYVALSMSLRIGGVERALLAIVLAATLLVLSLSQYLVWSAVGGPAIEGLQGRYFLPIAPIALLLISARWLRWTRWAVCVVGIPANAIALSMLARHYY